MVIVYRILGVTAKVNSALWRIRVNFIPINVVLIAVLIFLTAIQLSDFTEALHNSRTPRPTTIAEIKERNFPQNYVTVSGVMIPYAMYTARQAKGGAEKHWVPFFDTDRKRAILVQRPGAGPSEPGAPETKSIEGKLTMLPSELRAQIEKGERRWELEDYYMLLEGVTPGNPVEQLASLMIPALALACFAVATLCQNTIFRAKPGVMNPPSVAPASESVPVTVTGRLVLDKDTAKNFIDINAVIALHEGRPLVLANIDASSRFMGFKTKDRSGIWHLPVQPGSIHNGQLGELYYGFSSKPALRFSYRTFNGNDRTAIISAPDEKTLDVVVATLAPTPAAMSAV